MLFIYSYLQLDATSNTGNMDSSGTFTFVDGVLLARTVTRTCINSVSVASPRLDTSFNLNVMPYFLFVFDNIQAVRFVAHVRLSMGPNSILRSRRSILNDVMKFIQHIEVGSTVQRENKVLSYVGNVQIYVGAQIQNLTIYNFSKSALSQTI